MNKSNEEGKLKPLVFVKGIYPYNQDNKFQQMILLQALQVTQDPKKLKEMIGVKTVAEVYRTLDKLSIRKEYHKVLAEHGLTLDAVVDGIKMEAMTSPKSNVRLKAWEIILKSLGLNEYKEAPEESRRTWEETLMKLIEEKDQKVLERPKYEVIKPVVPESEKKRIATEEEIGRKLYE